MSNRAPSNAWGWLLADRRRFDLVVAMVTTVFAMALVLNSPENFETGWPEWVAGLGTFVLVALRRVAPIPLLAVSLVWVAAQFQIVERPTPMVFGVVVLLSTVCLRLERWPAIGLAAGIGVSLYVTGALLNDGEFADSRAVIGIVWAALAAGVADAVRSWRRLRQSTEAQVRSAVLAAEAETRQQVSEERLEIARELHDLLAHNLSVMNVQTGAALHLLRRDPDAAEQALTAARDAGGSVLDELRDLLSVLRHDEGEGSPVSSLPSIDELPALVDTMRSAGLDVAWTETGAARPLAPAVSLAAYRITQEALTNAAKHGNGTAELVTTWADDGLALMIANTTGRSAASSGGHGLVGMRERATLNGGRLSSETLDGRFVIDAWLPTANEVGA